MPNKLSLTHNLSSLVRILTPEMFSETEARSSRQSMHCLSSLAINIVCSNSVHVVSQNLAPDLHE